MKTKLKTVILMAVTLSFAMVSYGLLNHFDKDYTVAYLGYSIHINRPIVGTVMFRL